MSRWVIRRPASSGLGYKQQSPISPIGRSRDEQRSEKRAHRATVIAFARAHVFSRDVGCRFCGRAGRATDEMHEVTSRAKLRGQPPEAVFTTANCLRLCRGCHGLVTAHVFAASYARADLGCDGHVTFTREPSRWK